VELHDHEPVGENDTLARHIRLSEVLEGKRLLEWSDLETLIYDSHCLTPQGKQVAIWSIAILKEQLKDRFLVNAQQASEIITIYPFFALNFFPGANDVPRVYADVFRLALQLDLLQSLERFGGILRALRTSLQAVLWYHTLLQFEVASLAQKAGWQVQLELPYHNGTNNKSDVYVSKGETQLLIDAVAIRMSESRRKKQAYDNWLTQSNYHHEVQNPGKISSSDGSIALRCSLPGSCIRETIIIPRQGMEEDSLALAAIYEHEYTWLDWALQQAGFPPFHTHVREQW
jgi:hypothetical protein